MWTDLGSYVCTRKHCTAGVALSEGYLKRSSWYVTGGRRGPSAPLASSLKYTPLVLPLLSSKSVEARPGYERQQQSIDRCTSGRRVPPAPFFLLCSSPCTQLSHVRRLRLSVL